MPDDSDHPAPAGHTWDFGRSGFGADGAPLPVLDLDEMVRLLIAYALRRAEGTIERLAVLEARAAANKKRGDSDRKRREYHAVIRSSAEYLIQQMTAAQAALQRVTSSEDKRLIEVYVHQIDAAFTPYNLWGLSPVTEHVVSEWWLVMARTRRQPSPRAVAEEEAVDAVIPDAVLRTGKAVPDLLPGDVEDLVNARLPADQPIAYSTLARRLRAWKVAHGHLQVATAT